MVSLLTKENIFHSLFNTGGEEDIYQITTTLPCSIVHNVPIQTKRTEHTSITKFRVMILRIGRETCHYEMVVLHDMGLAIPKGMFG